MRGTIPLGLLIVFPHRCLTIEAASEERPVYALHRSSHPLHIDGEPTESAWSNALPAQIVVDPEATDFRASVRALWDADHLYVAFEVADGSPMKNAGNDPFLAFKTGDTVEVFLGTDPMADPNRVEPVASDHRVLITYLEDTRGIVHGYHPVSQGQAQYITHPTGAWRTRMDEHGPVAGAKVALKRNVDGRGYVLEAAIPWSHFGGFSPEPSLRVPFNLAVNFSDVAGRSNVAKAWWSGPGTMTTDIPTELRLNPNTWGWVLFQDESSNP